MSSTKNACVGRFFRIFAITTVRGYIFRLEKTRRIPDPFSPSVKSLRFLKSAACTISTNDTPPETGTLSLGEQTCADLRPRSCQRLQNIPGITLTNADPRYLISDSECFHFSFGRVDRESVSHQIFSRHSFMVGPDDQSFRCDSSRRIPLQKLPLSGHRNLSTLSNNRVATSSSITALTACFVSDLTVHFLRNHASREFGFGWFDKVQFVCP